MGMEEIYNDHQSSLVWTSMHDLASWSEEDGDQPKTTQKELFNDKGRLSVTGNTLWYNASKSYSTYQVYMYRNMKSVNTCGHMKPRSSSLASTPPEYGMTSPP